MHPIDLTIIVLYLMLMSVVGWWVAKKASRNAESYFLASKSLPWWVIGVAHGSSGLDITGTMWFVTMLFVYGVKATWLLWVWPLFNVIFRMMYLGTWVRRSNVLTGAEWMKTRFGNSRGAELAYLSVVAYALVSVVGFLSYAFRGIGKFTKPFFPWDWPDGAYATMMLLVTGIYCVVGGMYSVVMNDLIQFALKLVAAIAIAVIAISLISAEALHQPRRPGETPGLARLDHLERDDPPGDRLRPVHGLGAQRHRVDRFGARSRLRRAQRAEVALVAIQRLRLLRRDGRRDGRRDPQALRRRAPGDRLPPHPGGELHGLDRRLPDDPSRGCGDPEKLLQERPAVGILGVRSTGSAAPRIPRSRRTGTSDATYSISSSGLPGRPAW